MVSIGNTLTVRSAAPESLFKAGVQLVGPAHNVLQVLIGRALM
jgi:hypothetical protein